VEAIGPCVGEDGLDELGRKAASLELRLDLRVRERTRAAAAVAIFGEARELPVGRDLEAVLIDVVSDHRVRHDNRVATVEDVRALALSLPRTTEHLIHDRVKFRIGRIVYIAFSRDEEFMGFVFPKEERAAFVAGEPDKFMLPGTSDMRYNWVVARLDALSPDEMRELVTEAWRMCVPKRVAREHLGLG